MDIKQVLKVLNDKYDTELSGGYYQNINEWAQWWQGFNKEFHEIKSKDTNKLRLYSLRMAKKICEDWASILLNEETTVVVDDTPSHAYLLGNDSQNGLLDELHFWSQANRLVEQAFYSGTGAFVVKVDNLKVGTTGHIQASPEATVHLDYLPAQNIVPLSHANGRMNEVAFVSSETKKGKEYIYLETHTQEEGGYVIENSYYAVEKGVLKEKTLPDGVAPRLETGFDTPLFAIIKPNIINPEPNNLGLGCSVYSQALDALKGVDLAFNNFSRDFRLGGKKVFYNRELMKTEEMDSNGNYRYMAPDEAMQQLFMEVGDEFADSNTLIHEFNPTLRVEENAQGVQAQLDYLSFRCGLGTKHYRFEEGGQSVTATQYTGERQELRQNAARHALIVEEALVAVFRAILQVAKTFKGETVDPSAKITVEFADGYIISDEEKRENDRKDVQDFIMQPWEYRMTWYGEDEQTAKAMTENSGRTYGEIQFGDV